MSSTRLNLRFLFLQFLFFSLSQSPTAFLTISASTPTATTSPTHLNHQTIFSYYEQNYNRDTTRIVHVKFNAYPTRSMTNTWTVCTIDTGKIFPRTMRCENVYIRTHICAVCCKRKRFISSLKYVRLKIFDKFFLFLFPTLVTINTDILCFTPSQKDIKNIRI